MLDVKFIREHQDEVQTAARNKGIDLDVAELLRCDVAQSTLLHEIENLKKQKNELNDAMKSAKDGEERAVIIEKGKAVKEQLDALEPQYREALAAFRAFMVQVPTIPSSDTPIGKNGDDNVEIMRWGASHEFDFIPKDYSQLGKDLDLIDMEKGARVAGFRGYYLKNDGVSLVMAMMMYAINKMIAKGYKPFIPPTLVNGFALFGSGYFKGLEYNPEIDEIYQIASTDKEATGETSKEKKFLVGTAEPSLLAYYADEVLKEEDLPIRVFGFSPCYRSEIGSYGKDTKGMYRVHEFMKVEQVVVTKANVEESTLLQEEMVAIAKEIHEDLGLPYRVVQICTGDMSAGKYRAFDIEAWLPGSQRWAETGSASNFLDWQARRLNIKYVDTKGNKKFAYLLNDTALPSVRPFLAILENYQQQDGSVIVPEVLRPYMHGKEIITPW
ncbi:MAG: serine--tRNA ligase [Patescibacteria group bacterium]|nr:serine--tRNA ligase [Patescibacteria group bacterium]MDE2438648.1 serine--tRNA ligase [Patescibacteria group bacterium]